MVRKWGRLLGALLLCLTLSGCWDIREVKEMGLVVATGTDLGKQKMFKETAQISIPSTVAGKGGQGGAKYKSLLITTEAESIREMLPVLQDRADRNLYYSHRAVILVSEDVAKRGIGDFLDQFIREPVNRTRALILVVRGDTAQNVLEKVSGEFIEKLEMQNPGLTSTLHDFLIAQLGEVGNPVTGAIEFSNSKTESRKYTPLRL